MINKYSLKRYFKNTPQVVIFSDFLNNELLLSYTHNVKKDNFFVYQHGGSFGLNNYNIIEHIEKFYTENYLTWGFKNDSFDISFIGPLMVGNNIFEGDREGVCLILYDSPPYVSPYQPTISSNKFSRYLSFIYDFLNNKSLANLYLRFYPRNDSGIDYKNFFPNTYKLDQSKNVNLLYSKYELYIYTYNSTGYLEMWNLNIPCILFIEEENWYTSGKIKDYYLGLKKNNLLFSSTSELNIFLNKVQNNIFIWWNDIELQAQKNIFLSIYYNTDLNNISLKKENQIKIINKTNL